LFVLTGQPSLGFDNLRIYLIYQISDLFKTFVLTLYWVDLMTYALRNIPSMASLDTLPFVYGAAGVAENFLLCFLTLQWPARYVGRGMEDGGMEGLGDGDG
jgi:hypothetical protein